MRVLVVGQGLAGTLASHAALKRGWNVHVIDAGLPSASAVAAGMYNPMSFRRIVEVWEAETHLRIMRNTYSELEGLLGIRLLHDLPILKAMPNEDYAALWKQKSGSIQWLGSPGDAWPQNGTVSGGGWIDVSQLIAAWRQRLRLDGRFEQRSLTTSDREDHAAGTWDAIVDCRGIALTDDTQLTPLDIRANRGELLTISIAGQGETPPDQAILNFGKWTIPIGDSTWRLGASYEWNSTDLNPTDEAREFLIGQLSERVPCTQGLKVEKHSVGLRPVAKDRRPLVGMYPHKPRWFVFNGLGTRGVLIGPRWAEHLIQRINNDASLITDVEPSRLLFKPS